MTIPAKLTSLMVGEDSLRSKALDVLGSRTDLQIHLSLIESVMDLCDVHRKFVTDDENLKVSQVFAMRVFNAFGAALRLATTGYHQNCAMILRDVMETALLLDLFSEELHLIPKWRLAKTSKERQEFGPMAVRKRLDDRYGNVGEGRKKRYKMFCELAAHPTMQSDLMMRPKLNGDAVIGPFMEEGILAAVISEMGMLAVEVGGTLPKFMPSDGTAAFGSIQKLEKSLEVWIREFFPDQNIPPG